MKIPSLYIWLQIRMANRCEEEQIPEMPMEMVSKLLVGYKVPKKLRMLVLKEMELMGLVRVKEDYVKIINCKYQDKEGRFYTRMWKRKKQLDKMEAGMGTFFDF